MLKTIALSPRQSRLDELHQLLPNATLIASEYECGATTTLLAQSADQYRPDVMLLDCHICNAAMLGAVEQVCMRYPDLAILLLCDEPNSEFIINAMRIGVREVLPSPLDKDALLNAVSRVEQRIRQTDTVKHKQGKIIAFIACKGGSGATFLATNIAYILAAEGGAKVALLDLNMQFGDASLFVSDHAPTNTLADLADNIKRVDAALLHDSMMEILPNYHLLPAPEDPGRAAGVRPEHLEILLSLARAHYDYIILDIGRLLNATTLKALDLADQVYPVLQETLPFIRDSKRLVHTLQSLGYSRDKIRLLVNRHERDGSIGLKDVEAALGVKIFHTIPNSYQAVSSSVNQGIPIFRIARNDPVSKALLEFVQLLAEGKVMEERNSWLGRVFGHG